MGARPSNPKTVDPEQQQQRLRHSGESNCLRAFASAAHSTGEANYTPHLSLNSAARRVTLSLLLACFHISDKRTIYASCVFCSRMESIFRNHQDSARNYSRERRHKLASAFAQKGFVHCQSQSSCRRSVVLLKQQSSLYILGVMESSTHDTGNCIS